MKYVKESHINASPQVVFDFHESEGALLRLTPPWEKINVISQENSITPHACIVLLSRVGPFPVKWVAEHVDYDPPRMFSDRQVSGPFASWFHRHWFLDDGGGGTLLRDEIDYEVPLGAIGRWLLGGFVRQKIERMFEYRHEATRRIVESRDFVPRPSG